MCGVMADYLKPLIFEKKITADSAKEIEKEEEKESSIQGAISGMGDFEYKFPSKDHTESIEMENLEYLNKRTHSLMKHLEEGLVNSFEECRLIGESLNLMEDDMKKRTDVIEQCTSLFKDVLEQIEHSSETVVKTDETISHHEEILKSWRCIINDFRRVPDEFD